MRIIVKGGIWKNSEDEVLKAAVMKYGKSKWSRVASLMPNKTARQCKTRWLEWLDPAIKKTEWSPDEDEKLLHLVKIMPNQWRTIGPIVGRTAYQCIERYERLLDEVQRQSGESSSSSTDDPRRLRAGEIDPQPETRPARPDPVDMDENEKEMLSEARARFANTKGKKAKRKSRERLLFDGRRLAMIQKRRELKSAGIETTLSELAEESGMNKKNKKSNESQIDYAKEIPFYKPAMPVAYDFSSEQRSGNESSIMNKFKPVAVGVLEGGLSRDQQEKELRKRDVVKQKKIMRQDLPSFVESLTSSAAGEADRKLHGDLMLPEPQVSDGELHDIMSLADKTKPKVFLRTPMSSSSSSSLTRELRSLISIQNAPTPLMALSSDVAINYDDNMMNVPDGMVAGRGDDDDDGKKKKMMMMMSDIKAGLFQLPKPINRVKISVTDDDDDDGDNLKRKHDDNDDDDDDMVATNRTRTSTTKKKKSISSSLSSGLPRPIISKLAHRSSSSSSSSSSVSDLIDMEMMRTIHRESVLHPNDDDDDDDGPRKRIRMDDDEVDEVYLDRARMIVLELCQDGNDGAVISTDRHDDLMLLDGRYVPSSSIEDLKKYHHQLSSLLSLSDEDELQIPESESVCFKLMHDLRAQQRNYVANAMSVLSYIQAVEKKRLMARIEQFQRSV